MAISNVNSTDYSNWLTVKGKSSQNGSNYVPISPTNDNNSSWYQNFSDMDSRSINNKGISSNPFSLGTSGVVNPYQGASSTSSPQGLEARFASGQMNIQEAKEELEKPENQEILAALNSGNIDDYYRAQGYMTQDDLSNGGVDTNYGKVDYSLKMPNQKDFETAQHLDCAA